MVRAAAAASFGAQLLRYPEVWRDRSLPFPPNLPLFDWLPALPEPGGLAIWASMLAALVVVISGKWARGAAIYLAVAYTVMCGLDQVRFQPHFTVSPILLLIATWSGPSPEQALRGVRVALASVYFFAGLAKLNANYFTLVHPAMMKPVVELMPALSPLLEVSWIPPLVEMSVGAAVLYPGSWRRRRFVVAGALGMHAFILTMLLSASHDATVIPFNLALALCAVAVLVDSNDPEPRVRLRELGRTSGGRVALAYGVIVPALSLIGLADMYYSHAYYAGTEGRMRWYAKPEVFARFPMLANRKLKVPQVPPGAKPIPEGMYELPMHNGFAHFLGQAVVGEARIADAVKAQVCAFAASTPDAVIARYYGPAHPITGERRYRDARCGERLGFWLRFGGFATVVIGGDGPIETLEQHGAPF
jgi:hypothetical protein